MRIFRPYKLVHILNFSTLIASFDHHLVILYVTSSNYRMILLTYSRGQINDRKKFPKIFFPAHFLFYIVKDLSTTTTLF